MEGSIVDTRDGRRRPFRWQYGIVVFGSGVEADLVLPDPAIAAKHGRFEVTADGCRVVVAEGGKPVKVNGVPTHESDVEVGDVVKIGPFQLSLSGVSANAKTPAAAAPEAAPEPLPAAPAARRPASFSRHAAGAARPGAAKSDDAGLDEARAASRYRARTAGKGADARSYLIGGAILAGIALIAVGFFVFSGNPWAGLADDTMLTERAELNKFVKACDFEGALTRINQLMAKTKDSSLQNKLIDERALIERHKAEFDEGRHELDRLANNVGKKSSFYLRDDVRLFQNRYGTYKPLNDGAEDLLAQLAGLKPAAPNAAPTASDADLAPGATAPAFAVRPDREKGKEKQ